MLPKRYTIPAQWSLALISVIAVLGGLPARDSSVPVEGLHQYTPRIHALTGATVVSAPGNVLKEATIIIRDGRIEQVGQGIPVPADAREWDLSGKTVYAGFIDAYSQLGMPEGLKPYTRELPAKPDTPAPKEPPSPGATGAAHWNPLVTPQRAASDFFNQQRKQVEGMQVLGFTAAAVFPGRGILRGQGLLKHVDLRGLQESVIANRIAQHVSFEVNGWGESYPTSLMGSIALVRQALYDAQWYDRCWKAYDAVSSKVERPEYNQALEALSKAASGKQLTLFHARDELDYQRIQKIGNEFGLAWAILGNGYEYRRASILKESGATVIVPVAFPPAPPVERVDTALEVSLEQLEHWELAPCNPGILEDKGIPFCLTSFHMDRPEKEFWQNLRRAVRYGLSSETALAALTTEPANLLQAGDRLGTIEKGKIGNLVVATGDLFADDKSQVAMVWIDGEPVELEPWNKTSIAGRWRFEWDSADGFDEAVFETKAGKVTLKAGNLEIPGVIEGAELLLYPEAEMLGMESDGKSLVRLRASINSDSITGVGSLPDGGQFSWTASQVDVSDAVNAGSGKPDTEPAPDARFAKYPSGAFGVESRFQPREILVRNATVWTSGPDGILAGCDLLIRDGKIVAVGRKLDASSDAHIIDASGKHVTPGIIDCHSHLAISRGVNEGSHAVTAEVRIGDVVNPVDINIYRQLAGGVTTSNSLHGSANPIGGLGQVLRLRWGEDADGIKFQQAAPSIKFALGENVKQSNWNKPTNRYPQTRMGVPEIMESVFRAAEDYQRRHDAFKSGKRLLPPRIDLGMEAMLETLRKERIIHIHAYRQDEILEFSRLAGRLDLDVAAFQHVLEGYKVVEAMNDIGAGGSSFADWWAYKFEVFDAIPQNAAVMHDEGVIVSINSDDAELATRLTTEAAKTVKYGGVSEEDALKFVTINPAIQLGIETIVGSLERGKDADFVIWSDHPLSTFAHAEQTWIEGVRYFDIDENRRLVKRDTSERERLVQKALKSRLKELKLDPSGDKPETMEADKSEDPHNWLYRDENFDYGDFGTSGRAGQ